jgi:CBS domain-containing protein
VSTARPRIVAATVSTRRGRRLVDFAPMSILKIRNEYVATASELRDFQPMHDGMLSLTRNVLDRQIVDIDGRKIVRVNDIRLANTSNGTFAVAVDVGIEGLLRRLGIAKVVKSVLKPFRLSMPSDFILWDEFATVDFSNAGIKLSKKMSKLATLHPSDLADIIEDLDRNTQLEILTSLDEEQAADVLEELETDAQVAVLENLAVEKAADVLERMPADEVADILDELHETKAEELLSEMETEAQQEVRDLMEYPENSVGSLMSTDFISFNENLTVGDTLAELRRLKPESDTIYYLYVLDDESRLVATVSLRDAVVSDPGTKLSEIMNEQVIYIKDTDRIDTVADTISKYNLLAIPVVDEKTVLVGMVLIDDIVHTMIKSKRRRM